MTSNPRDTCESECPRYCEKIHSPVLAGCGPATSKILVVGEAPGQSEDVAAKPFIGESGRLLRQALSQAGIEPEEIFITNAVKCATAGVNQAPNKKTIKLCRKYLEEEIKRVQPNVIAVFGAVALESVLKRTGISKLKNNIFHSEEFNVKVIPIYHPAYILRNPGALPDFVKGISLLASEANKHSIVRKPKYKEKHKDCSNNIDRVLEVLEGVDKFVFDLETSSLEFTKAEILCVALSWKSGIGITIRWPEFTKSQLKRFVAILQDKNKLKINQNIKFDLEMLLSKGIRVRGPFFDTLIAASLIDENMKEKGLDALTLSFLDIGEYWSELEETKLKICKASKIRKDQFSYSMFPYSVLASYAQWDADATYRLYEIFEQKLKKIDLEDYFYKYSMPTMQLLTAMEFKGVLVDRPQLKSLIKEYETKLKSAHKQIRNIPDVKDYERDRKAIALAQLEEKYYNSSALKKRYPSIDEYASYALKDTTWKFNQRSVQQLAEILFDRLKLEPIKKSLKTNNPSTDRESLELFAKQGVDLCTRILTYRQLGKYIATYLVSTYQKSKVDSRIHANYLQAKARTGRLSCVAPNMQNIPRDAKDFKSCLIADPGYLFVKADLKQAEFRCWAHYSEDPDMLHDLALGSKFDVHRKTAAEVFGVPEEEVTPEQRTAAKGCVFGLLFGRGAPALAEAFSITLEQAKNIKKAFFARYPVAEEWLQNQITFAHKHGYVKTWLGRYRRLPEIFSEEPGLVAKAEREALNSPIQGLASNMNDYYMVLAHRNAKKKKIDCFPVVTQHDAQIFLVRENQQDALIDIMKHVVQTAFPDFKTEMVLDFEVGKTLGTLEAVK